MGLFGRARKTFGIGLDEGERAAAAERDAGDECWGRIVAVEARRGPLYTLEVEVHVGRTGSGTETMTTTPPRGHEPAVGDDVAIALREGDQTEGHLYRIEWDEPPRYGIPAPTGQQLQDAALPGLLTDDPAAKPPGLADAERMRDNGEVSEAAFQTMKANILGPGERLKALHDSGQMSDEIYAKALASERRFAAGVKIGPVPTLAAAGANLDQALDDSVELDLQRRGTLTTATVVGLPAPDPADRSILRMALDVTPPAGGPPYRVDCAFPAARPVDLLTVGTALPVKVDPDDREQVAVIWNRWLADRGE
jgi:hypothetical protein